MKLITLIVLLTSCSHHIHPKKGIIDEVNEGNISSQSVLDLARSSYLRGCVDSKNYWLPEKNVSAFEKCRQMAIEHQKDISSILNAKIPTKILKKKVIKE